MYVISKQILAIGLPVAVVAATGVAVAYWTTNGSGTGEATTAAGASTLQVAQAAPVSGLAPGVAAAAISVEVTNSGTASVRANQVVVSIDSVTKAAGAPAGTCSAADYVLTGPTMTDAAGDLAPSASVTFTGATLAFNNTAANQDGCKGATVTLAYTAS